MIVVDSVEVGFLRVERRSEEIFLASIQLDPKYQRRGIGTAVIQTFLQEARSSNRIVRLTVLRVNPARTLYERLGFRVTGETDTHFEMRAG